MNGSSKLLSMMVGVVAIQGDFAKHFEAIERLNRPMVKIRELRVPEDLSGVDRVIIPGGESTTVGMLMQRFGLAEALQEKVSSGLPVWGTCMGMIMLSKEIEDRPDQFSLGLLNITVRRNAFGSQINSFEDEVTVLGIDKPVNAVFIRAPIVTKTGPEVETIAVYQGQIVAVKQGHILGTSFHPELTEDSHMHAWFLDNF